MKLEAFGALCAFAILAAGLIFRTGHIRRQYSERADHASTPLVTCSEPSMDAEDRAYQRGPFIPGELVRALRDGQNDACNRAHNAAIERAARLCEARAADHEKLAATIRAMKVRPRVNARPASARVAEPIERTAEEPEYA